LASINAAAVFIVNTTGHNVEFEIPGGGADPNRPTGLFLMIPGAAPSNPSAILAGHGPGGQPGFSLEQLINGDTDWDKGPLGAYGVVFLTGELNLLSLLGLEVSGYILLSEEVMSLELNFYAGVDFLGLFDANASGTVFFSSEGEFEVDVDCDVQLGPDWINIHGSADLLISFLDDNGKASGGNLQMVPEVTGSLSVGLTVDIWPFPAINLDLDILTVHYESGEITVSVTYLKPYWARGWLGIPYPSFEWADYTFHIGTFTIDPPPPPVLGQVGAGVLTLNVGPNAAARNLLVDEVNEDVTIDRVGDAIRISMFGYSQLFYNVSEILISDMGDGDDVVEILPGVTVPVEVHFGPGGDRLRVVIAYGDGDDDRLEGGSANDQLFGGLGSDFIDGKAGQDWIEGGDGSDLIIGGADDDIINGGPGVDRIMGDLVNVTGDETTSVFQTIGSALGGNDIIEGGDGADVILGGSGNDVINGGAGEDLLIGDDGTVTFSQEGMTFTLTYLDFSGNDIIDGGAGNDTLFGQKGEDILLGGEGDDDLYGDEGSDTIYGGSGLDVIYGGTEADTIYGNEDRDLIYGNAGNDELHGGTGNDDIYGDSGNDLIYGNEDDDQIYGGTGDDIINGNAGDDYIQGNEERDTINGGTGDDEIYGDDGNDLIHGNSGDDLIYGGNGSDRIYGDENNDIIYGGNEADIIFGGVHDDYIYGQNGDDILFGDNGDAQLSLFAIDSNIESDDGNDHIYGEAGSDIIIGGGANDAIIGDNAEDGTPDFRYTYWRCWKCDVYKRCGFKHFHNGCRQRRNRLH